MDKEINSQQSPFPFAGGDTVPWPGDGQRRAEARRGNAAVGQPVPHRPASSDTPPPSGRRLPARSSVLNLVHRCTVAAPAVLPAVLPALSPDAPCTLQVPDLITARREVLGHIRLKATVFHAIFDSRHAVSLTVATDNND